MNKLEQIFGNRLLKDEPMSKHSTLRIGGPARYFLEARNADDVIRAVTATREEAIPYVVIGGGSNILCSDSGFDGLVIKMTANEIKVDGAKIYADAGVFSAVLARKAAVAGLTGIEWMVTLPGTVGGAVYGNAGAYGAETKDKLLRVRVLEVGPPTGGWELGVRSLEPWIEAKNGGFGYRNSIFKKGGKIILGAEFELGAGDPAPEQARYGADKGQVTRRMNELLEKRKNEQPLGSSSAGCIFKNFKIPTPNFQLPTSNSQLPEEFLKNKMIPAGWLIDRAGLKGFCVGKMRVSDIHGNFSLNTGGATAEELRQLISLVKAKIYEKFGIELQEEVQYIGFRT